ncbi:hypothetical protein CHS0354_035794 [Potamilus streckersoni]|uniref:Espin n=1 Tax=Potamilus streckersoni TaxID=2493646 RepID=A0AAE0SWL3_9BIVA|nr:hypothetical protein CHS0354_035794 [Potamilus streckersoni]
MVALKILSAVSSGDLQLLQTLGGQVTEEVSDETGATCLHYAARKGMVNIMEYLVKTKGFKGSVRSRVGSTPAHDAAAAGILDSLKWLLENTGCKVDDRDGAGATVLHLACRHRHTHVARWIITESNCDVMIKTSTGALPLHFAAESGDLEIVNLLLREAPTSVNWQTMNGMTPVYVACQKGQLDTLRQLIEGKGTVKIKTYDGMSCLHTAAQNGHLECVKYLIHEQDCNSNERDFDGATPLHFAASQGRYRIVDWLMKNGGARVMLDNLGGSPLHNAAETGQLQCVKILLANGCSPDITDNKGLTAEELAEKCWNEECALVIRHFAKEGYILETQVLYPDYKLGARAHRNSVKVQPSTKKVTCPGKHLSAEVPCFQSGETGECESYSSHTSGSQSPHVNIEISGRDLSSTVSSLSSSSQADQNNFYSHQDILRSHETTAVQSARSQQNIVNLKETHKVTEFSGLQLHSVLHTELLSRFNKMNKDKEEVNETNSGDNVISEDEVPSHLKTSASQMDKLVSQSNGEAENSVKHPEALTYSNKDKKQMNGNIPQDIVTRTKKMFNENSPGSQQDDKLDSVQMQATPSPAAPALQPPPPPPPPAPILNGNVDPKVKPSGTDFARSAISFDKDLISAQRNSLQPSIPHSSGNTPRNHDFVAELKQVALKGDTLKKINKPEDVAKMNCVFSFGQSSKTSNSTTSAATTTKENASKVHLVGEWDPKNFLDQVPDTDGRGVEIPGWRKQMLARNIAEKAYEEAQEKKKVEERESRFKNVPAWKRAMIEKKEAEARLAEENPIAEKKSVSKKT